MYCRAEGENPPGTGTGGEMTQTYYTAWWNLENLFDEENAPPSRRPDKVMRAIGSDIVGWTPQLRDRKIAQLASVIARMNRDAGPDLLGVCEVENRFVLDLLTEATSELSPERAYTVVHADTHDARGIDVAFIYDEGQFEVPDGATFFHVVMRRNATRDILQVNFRTATGTTWTVFANHWPSRSGGPHTSAGYRHIAGETLAYFHQRSLEIHGPETAALAMGDFNDEPFDTSLVVHALSTRRSQRTMNAREVPRLWNLMWPLLGQGEGTFYYDNQPNMLDQFLVNKNMIGTEAGLRADPDSVEIVRFEGMARDGDYPGPKRYGGMRTVIDEDGYSDHFPIGLRVTEAT